MSLSLVIAGTARAQQPDTRRFTVGATSRGLSGAANLENPGAIDWRLGWAASANATYWVQRYVGVRANLGGPAFAAGIIVTAAPAVAQEAPTAKVVLPDGDIFRPLLADPKQPQFFATYFWTRSPRLGAQIASVGFGRDIGLVRLPNGRWQLSLAAGVFSRFNMDSKSSDLLDVDYIVGFPITYRRGPVSARLQVYHQSSHLGDEFILHTQTQRIDLTYEAAELLLSDEVANWRVYGGGEYIYAHQPSDLKPGLLHAGLEYRQRTPLVRLGRFGGGRLVAALDGKSFQDRSWQVGWSLQTGLAFTPTSTAGVGGWGWSVLLEAYGGPAPFGQFYRENISSVGLGVAFDL